jgi:predicted nuclease of restriction endonuclease-like (RecB) superfamily
MMWHPGHGVQQIRRLAGRIKSRDRRHGMSKGAATETNTGELPPDYTSWLASLKQRIQSAQQRAALAVNRELVLLYWQIGQDILARQQAQGWGAKVIDRLARDLSAAFPGMKGFSPRNLKYMRAFAEAWPDGVIVQEVLAQLPWYHQLALLDKLKTREDREWYAARAVEHGWSRNILAMQIESGLHRRQGAAQSNFDRHLPPLQSDLARHTLKDPYIFDFLDLGEAAQERDIESALVKHVTRFLLELGAGFAFVGRQHPLTVGDEDFYIDLLFYHLKLRCYVVVELKATPFRPEYAGQLNFYLSAVDADIKTSEDNPTIGLLLCKSHNKTVAEYALRGMEKAMGIADYQLVRAIPENLSASLPTIEQIEMELQQAERADDAAAKN